MLVCLEIHLHQIGYQTVEVTKQGNENTRSTDRPWCLCIVLKLVIVMLCYAVMLKRRTLFTLKWMNRKVNVFEMLPCLLYHICGLGHKYQTWISPGETCELHQWALLSSMCNDIYRQPIIYKDCSHPQILGKEHKGLNWFLSSKQLVQKWIMLSTQNKSTHCLLETVISKGYSLSFVIVYSISQDWLLIIAGVWCC